MRQSFVERKFKLPHYDSMNRFPFGILKIISISSLAVISNRRRRESSDIKLLYGRLQREIPSTMIILHAFSHLPQPTHSSKSMFYRILCGIKFLFITNAFAVSKDSGSRILNRSMLISNLQTVLLFCLNVIIMWAAHRKYFVRGIEVLVPPQRRRNAEASQARRWLLSQPEVCVGPSGADCRQASQNARNFFACITGPAARKPAIPVRTAVVYYRKTAAGGSLWSKQQAKPFYGIPPLA